MKVADDALPSGRRTRDSIDGLAELVSRSQRQTMAVELAEAGDVTALFRQELGARPIDAAGALRWDRALKAVEAYRSLDRDRGDDTLLGPRPAESGARLHWTTASLAVERARRGHVQDLGREL